MSVKGDGDWLLRAEGRVKHPQLRATLEKHKPDVSFNGKVRPVWTSEQSEHLIVAGPWIPIKEWDGESEARAQVGTPEWEAHQRQVLASGDGGGVRPRCDHALTIGRPELHAKYLVGLEANPLNQLLTNRRRRSSPPTGLLVATTVMLTTASTRRAMCKACSALSSRSSG